jgi:GNAT superfamily N-acetyltransferase
MIKFQVEQFSKVVDEAQPLLERHWEEVALYKDFVPLSPNYARYASLEASGKLLIITGRIDAALIAYAAFHVDFADNYSTVLFAINKLVWVMPEWRGRHAGVRLIKRCEQELLDRGVSVVHWRAKLTHPELAGLLGAMNYEPIETVHSKILQRPE